MGKRVFSATFPNNAKRAENTTRSWVLLTSFEVFGDHCGQTYGLECLIYPQPRSQGLLLLGPRVGEDPENEADVSCQSKLNLRSDGLIES